MPRTASMAAMPARNSASPGHPAADPEVPIRLCEPMAGSNEDAVIGQQAAVPVGRRVVRGTDPRKGGDPSRRFHPLQRGWSSIQPATIARGGPRRADLGEQRVGADKIAEAAASSSTDPVSTTCSLAPSSAVIGSRSRQVIQPCRMPGTPNVFDTPETEIARDDRHGRIGQRPAPDSSAYVWSTRSRARGLRSAIATNSANTSGGISVPVGLCGWSPRSAVVSSVTAAEIRRDRRRIHRRTPVGPASPRRRAPAVSPHSTRSSASRSLRGCLARTGTARPGTGRVRRLRW